MRGGTVWTVIGVIVAIAIAWFLVNLLFSVAWFILKVGLVLLVAVGVYFALRALFARTGEE